MIVKGKDKKKLILIGDLNSNNLSRESSSLFVTTTTSPSLFTI